MLLKPETKIKTIYQFIKLIDLLNIFNKYKHNIQYFNSKFPIQTRTGITYIQDITLKHTIPYRNVILDHNITLGIFEENILLREYRKTPIIVKNLRKGISILGSNGITDYIYKIKSLSNNIDNLIEIKTEQKEILVDGYIIVRDP